MDTVSETNVRPLRSLNLLSHREISELMETNAEVFRQFRQCALAVLNTDSQIDDAAEMLTRYADFNIEVVPQSRGLKLKIYNAPASSFVDGVMIRGIRDHLFAALRDIVYSHNKIAKSGEFDLQSSAGTTDAVFKVLRNADIVRPNQAPDLVVCWGGHSISRAEYDYSKRVGYELGLRGINIATGCGLGAMKGPMKGAAVGHAKQQLRDGRYMGISEPGIIASESPNPIVNELVILPDIEKRLEAFVRLAHCVVVFPGGAGTAEEVLYLISILMHSKNKNKPFPLIFAAPESSGLYFSSLNRFIRNTLGEEATRCYQIIIGQPDKVAREVKHGIERVHRFRRKTQEAYYFNWQIEIDRALQTPFIPTHENMAGLRLDRELPAAELAAQLRCAFSGIVAGNVKAFGIEQIAEKGPYQLRGDPAIMAELEQLLQQFVQQRRMKLGAGEYHPCYELQSG
ncbi:LOG family protein [Exilibacterium tricleocarpae]|uniref:AMP nucleosidase n=1 Tax=Exilibacterium tricleocarpae TaxID=2591008 RepID=A0A545T3M5_9GAMM|nr:nucleotide 5'-monophosphate nucleosidase PpnN [Exilibacterium tricleocarpae]TQV71819.1 LOG family protein [Exilibacterium tricleocarpae]